MTQILRCKFLALIQSYLFVDSRTLSSCSEKCRLSSSNVYLRQFIRPQSSLLILLLMKFQVENEEEPEVLGAFSDDSAVYSYCSKVSSVISGVVIRFFLGFGKHGTQLALLSGSAGLTTSYNRSIAWLYSTGLQSGNSSSSAFFSSSLFELLLSLSETEASISSESLMFQMTASMIERLSFFLVVLDCTLKDYSGA